MTEDHRLQMVVEVLTEMGIHGTVIWRRTIRGSNKSAIRKDALRFLEDEAGLKRVDGIWHRREDQGSANRYSQAIRARMDQYKVDKAEAEEIEKEELLETGLIAAGHDPAEWLRD